VSKMRTYLYQASLKGKRHDVYVTLASPAYRKNRRWLKGELRLWIDNDEGLYAEFYGRNAPDKITCAKHKDVAITEVDL